MNEAFITRSILKYFTENNYEIIQCILPGAQGSLNFLVKNKNIYPDFICFKEGIFLIGESKPKYDESDEKKLFNLSEENNLILNSERILKNYLNANNLEISNIEKIIFFLGFASDEERRSDQFDNYLVNPEGNVTVLKN
jgi:hypothetical protein